MSRSLKKGPYVDLKLEAKVIRQTGDGKREPITTWARACTITPDFVGHTFMVHDGRRHQKVYVVEDMVGYKPRFAAPRQFVGCSSVSRRSSLGVRFLAVFFGSTPESRRGPEVPSWSLIDPQEKSQFSVIA